MLKEDDFKKIDENLNFFEMEINKIEKENLEETIEKKDLKIALVLNLLTILLGYYFFYVFFNVSIIHLELETFKGIIEGSILLILSMLSYLISVIGSVNPFAIKKIFSSEEVHRKVNLKNFEAYIEENFYVLFILAILISPLFCLLSWVALTYDYNSVMILTALFSIPFCISFLLSLRMEYKSLSEKKVNKDDVIKFEEDKKNRILELENKDKELKRKINDHINTPDELMLVQLISNKNRFHKINEMIPELQRKILEDESNDLNDDNDIYLYQKKILENKIEDNEIINY